MNKDMTLINVAMGAVGGVISNALGGWTLALQLLIILMILDYTTGIVNAAFSKTLSSQTGFKGIIKKVVMLAIISVAAQADAVLNTNLLREIVIYFYISNEGISFLENTAKLGVPYPRQIKDMLIQIGKMSEKSNVEINNEKGA